MSFSAEFSEPDVSTRAVKPHHSSPLTIAGGDAEKIVTYSLLATSILAASVVVAPLVLPALGIGAEVEKQLLDECCKNITPDSGIASGVSQLINDIPVVGTYLNTADGNNLIVPAATMLGSYTAGSLVSHFEEKAGGSGVLGSAIRITGMALGVILSLPALLPGLAHGTLFLGRLTGLGEYALPIAQGLGTNACAVLGPEGQSGKVTQAFAAVSGAKTGFGLVAGHAACLAPAVLTAGGAVFTAAGGSKAEAVLAGRDEQKSTGRERG